MIISLCSFAFSYLLIPLTYNVAAQQFVMPFLLHLPHARLREVGSIILSTISISFPITFPMGVLGVFTKRVGVYENPLGVIFLVSRPRHTSFCSSMYLYHSSLI